MGDVLFDRMSKGPIHEALEVCVNNYRRRQLLYDALHFLDRDNRDNECLSDYLLILKEIVRVPEEAADYLGRWYTTWGSNPSYEPIIRRGILHAIEVANDPIVLPIDFYWLGAGDRNTYKNFETIVTRSRWQVTCIILTPPWPEPQSHDEIAKQKEEKQREKQRNERTRLVDIWTVKDSGNNTTGSPQTGAASAKVDITRASALPPEHSMQSSTVRQPPRRTEP